MNISFYGSRVGFLEAIDLNSVQYNELQQNSFLNKATKSWFKRSLPIVSPEIENDNISSHVYLNFLTRYYWKDPATCYMEISWEPWYLDGETKTKPSSLTEEFSQTNNITINVNGTQISQKEDLSDYESLLPTYGDLSLIDGGSFLDTDGTSFISLSQYVPKIYCYITNLENNVLNIPISFKYGYTNENNCEFYVSISGRNIVKIPKPSRYDKNIVFNESGLLDFVKKIKEYPVVDVDEVPQTDWESVSDGNPSIKVTFGNPTKINSNTNVRYVKVGSNVIFEGATVPSSSSTNQLSGTFRVSVNNTQYEVPIKGFAENYTPLSSTSIPTLTDAFNNNNLPKYEKDNNGNYVKTSDNPPQAGKQYYIKDNIILNGPTNINGDLMPGEPDIYNIGEAADYIELSSNSTPTLNEAFADSNLPKYIQVNGKYVLTSDATPQSGTTYYINKGYRWKSIYAQNGYFDNLEASSLTINGVTLGASGGSGASDKFLRSDGSWANNLTGPFIVGETTNPYVSINNNDNDGVTSATESGALIYYGNSSTAVATAASIYTQGGIYAAKNIWGNKVFNAVFNDYAECRTTIALTPGHVVVDNDDGSLACASKRLQPGAQVISDTYGHLMGGTEEAQTPIAVAGRVLVYTYQEREKYHAGMAVCSAPNGTVDIMTREEIRDYPDCIVGIVSEIPQYNIWGSDNVEVNGRIWIKVK